MSERNAKRIDCADVTRDVLRDRFIDAAIHRSLKRRFVIVGDHDLEPRQQPPCEKNHG